MSSQNWSLVMIMCAVLAYPVILVAFGLARYIFDKREQKAWAEFSKIERFGECVLMDRKKLNRFVFVPSQMLFIVIFYPLWIVVIEPSAFWIFASLLLLLMVVAVLAHIRAKYLPIKAIELQQNQLILKYDRQVGANLGELVISVDEVDDVYLYFSKQYEETLDIILKTNVDTGLAERIKDSPLKIQKRRFNATKLETVVRIPNIFAVNFQDLEKIIKVYFGLKM